MEQNYGARVTKFVYSNDSYIIYILNNSQHTFKQLQKKKKMINDINYVCENSYTYRVFYLNNT